MKRREFVAATGLAGLAPIHTATSLINDAPAELQYFELRRYVSRTGSHRQKLNDYLQHAAIPAWNRNGVTSVGAFSVVYGPNAPSIYVLLSHNSLASVSDLRGKMAADETYQEAAAGFLTAPLSDPSYVRIESGLFKAFTGMPKLEVPKAAANNDKRIFELRIYESHSEPAAIRKVEMFNKGEIDIFLKTGLTPVFFGEAMIGDKLPNLTYMLTFKDMADRDESWGKFIAHPDWAAMKADPYYKDTVSNITSIILRPLPFSQV